MQKPLPTRFGDTNGVANQIGEVGETKGHRVVYTVNNPHASPAFHGTPLSPRQWLVIRFGQLRDSDAWDRSRETIVEPSSSHLRESSRYQRVRFTNSAGESKTTIDMLI